MTFDIDTTDLRTAADVLASSEHVIDPAAALVVDELGSEGERSVRARAARHRRTGRMDRQVRLQVTGEGAGTVARIRAGGPIAAMVISGTTPHLIIPRRGRALALTALGARSFAARVQHPGTVADPFVARAFDDVLDQADNSIDAAGDRIAGGLAEAINRRA